MVGWSIADHLRSELVVDALQMAIWRRNGPTGTIVHSDHGTQYTSWAFGRRLRAAGLLGSMGTVGDAFDNAVAESFFGTLQLELLDRTPLGEHASELAAAIFEWIECFYNPHRRHSYRRDAQPHRLRDHRPRHDHHTQPRPESGATSLSIASAVAEAGPAPEVVIEATYGWYWIVDLLQEQGATVHLANPSGLNWGTRRVKNDERDAVDLIDMLRLGRLPEAWIAPPATRELRELVRYRAKLVALRSGLKAQVHAVMAKEGVLPTVSDMFCQAATRNSTRSNLPTRTRRGAVAPDADRRVRR